MDIQAINKARILFYGYFSALFSFHFTEEKFSYIKATLDFLSTHPIDEQSELAFKNMKRRVQTRGFEALKNESDRVFCNPLLGSVPMTASFILEQRDDGHKRIEMIDYLQQSSFRRNSGEYKEHEDHIEFILLFLQRLILQEMEGNEEAEKLFRNVFAHILNPMVDEFQRRLANHEQSSFYRQAVIAFESFIEFERVFLDVGQPLPVQQQQTVPKANLNQEQRTQAGCIRMQHEEYS